MTQPHAQHARAGTSVHADGNEQQGLGSILSGDDEQTILFEKGRTLLVQLIIFLCTLLSTIRCDVQLSDNEASAKSIASYCVPNFNMLASIILDQSFPHYTNLDYITGKVYVRTQTATTVSSIVVKLEGESRTRLLVCPLT